MHKILSILALAASFSILTACNDDEPDNPLPDDEENVDSPSDDGDDDDTPKVVDLSADEMANCYIVQAEGVYKFKADNRFNLGDGLPVPPEIDPATARLIWQTEPGLVNSVELVEDTDGTPYMQFEIAKAQGNALIGACDSNGAIVWSWHIWMPIDEVESVHTDTGYDVMNLNLGALANTPGTVDAYGMLYQWGRKDPFPAAPTLTGDATTIGAPLYDIDGKEVKITYSSWYNNDNNNMAYAIANPTECLSNYSHYATSRDWLKDSDDSLWGNPDGDYRDSNTNTFPNKGRKTCYDPSPAGWRVAPADVFRNLTTSGGYAWVTDDFKVADVNKDGIIDMADYNYGWHFLVSGSTPLFLPAASRYDGRYAMLMGSMSGLWGNFWSNSPYTGIAGGAYCCLSFSVRDMTGNAVTTVSPAGGSSRADAFSVRCVRDGRLTIDN